MEIGAEWLAGASGCLSDGRKEPPAPPAALLAPLPHLPLPPAPPPPFHPSPAPLSHLFPKPGGITGFVVLSESHLACHTYPEHGVITINLYCCRPRPEWSWREGLAAILGATDVYVRTFSRATMAKEMAAAWP